MDDDHNEPRRLEPRAQAVLVLMGQALTNEEIAVALRLELADASRIVDDITAFLARRDDSVDANGLSLRERSVRALLESGATHKDIAAQLDMTDRGVADVVQRIRAKLGLPPGHTLKRRAVLPNRQRRVAELIAAGHTDPEIARVLGLSPRTVETHVSRLLRRLGVRSRKDVGGALTRLDQDRAAEISGQ